MADAVNSAPAEGVENTTTAPAADTQPQGNTLLTGTTPAGSQADAPKPEGKPDAKNGGPKAAEPEAYELTAPDGYPMSEGDLKALNGLCKEAKLSKAQGEAVLKYLHGNYTSWQEGQAAQVKKWAEEARADKEFGGDKFDANVADARRGLATFDTDGSIRAMLEETGYGNHPAVLKIFARVGKALGEDKLVGVGGNAREDKPLEDRLWPDMK